MFKMFKQTNTSSLSTLFMGLRLHACLLHFLLSSVLLAKNAS